MSVIITHARNRTALVATQSLGKRGIKVVTADSIYPSTSFFSRYSTSYFVYPSEKLTPELFINSLRDYVHKNNINVLMPMDEETFIVSKYKDRFPTSINIPVADYETLKKANNNRYLMKFAAEIGVNTPQTWTIERLEDLRQVAKEVEYPAVIKLVEGVGSKGLRFAHSEDELIAKYIEVVQKFHLKPFEYPLIQEYIPGDSYGVSLIFNCGEPRAICMYKNIRTYPIYGGPSTARISIKHDKMGRNAIILLRELNYHGVAEVEFRIDDRTKEPVLMEINPRFWGSLNQAICAGVDFPYLLYTMAMEGDIQPVLTYKTEVKTRWMLGDLRALVDYLRTNKRMEILKDFLKFNGQYYDDLSFSDPIPTIAEMMIPIMNFIKTGKLKFSPEEER